MRFVKEVFVFCSIEFWKKHCLALSQILCKRLIDIKRGEVVVAGGGLYTPPVVSKIADCRMAVKGAVGTVEPLALDGQTVFLLRSRYSGILLA